MPRSSQVTDFLQLRRQVYELARLTPRARRIQFPLPPAETGRPTDVVEVSEFFKTALAAVAQASRRLRNSARPIALGSEPVTIQFSARLAEIIPERGQIYIQLISPAQRRKEKKD